MKVVDKLKIFHLQYTLAQAGLDGVEAHYSIDLGRSQKAEITRDDTNYPQFSLAIRAEASAMAEHYEVFYCLENAIRDLVSSQLLSKHGETWWTDAVPDVVKQNVQKNRVREEEAGITIRSVEMIDYTTFGELGEIIQANWEVFADTLNNRKAVTRVLAGLNLLRGPIAHCCPLAPDEVMRLQLALADWFRLTS